MQLQQHKMRNVKISIGRKQKDLLQKLPTAGFVAIVSGRTSSCSASCCLVFNGPLRGAAIAVGRGEKKENKILELELLFGLN